MPFDPNSIDSGATAWILASSALVLLMTPGLAFFYGGMVRAKNVLGMLMQNFFCMGIVSILWVTVTYSIAFGDANGFIGGFHFVGLAHMSEQVPGYTAAGSPQVIPPPMASNRSRSPRLTRPSCTASVRASGIDAAEVFAWRSTVTMTRSTSRPSLLATLSMMRTLAWWGTTQVTWSLLTPCQSGRRTCAPDTDMVTRPSSSYCGQPLAKNGGDSTTRPNRLRAIPLSTFRRIAERHRRVNRSDQHDELVQRSRTPRVAAGRQQASSWDEFVQVQHHRGAFRHHRAVRQQEHRHLAERVQ